MTPKSARIRLDQVQARIRDACRRAGRAPDSVRLVAVSKTRGPEAVRTLHAAGVKAFGENYASEATTKIAALTDLAIEWHFIGPLQSNKTRIVARDFDWVQSVDRLKLVRRLGMHRSPQRPPLQVLIQVNIDDEAGKAGCHPEQIQTLAEAITAESRLQLRGLMAIPAPAAAGADPESFRRMHECFDRLARQFPGVDTLSMGMSADLEAAIEAGSTMVRVGTALFGPR
ncbi:MAG: YggS family pyridoxal phosphate-dependent enzyme [Wenzhouxiangellaceae bacterium]